MAIFSFVAAQLVITSHTCAIFKSYDRASAAPLLDLPLSQVQVLGNAKPQRYTSEFMGGAEGVKLGTCWVGKFNTVFESPGLKSCSLSVRGELSGGGKQKRTTFYCHLICTQPTLREVKGCDSF